MSKVYIVAFPKADGWGGTTPYAAYSTREKAEHARAERKAIDQDWDMFVIEEWPLDVSIEEACI